ncbi:DUF2244 domain-containing protein [Ruegeria pomeroyi]|uniref:DUF2244 domain-containing protein n=1 Tax=Ruegeria pomeroyi TaxID=89184 RepID=A0A9Q3ZKR7_9RHOB|nr:DUF2244 domain-containing protein [Ruegeria pomeroyi]MCE8521129.1 DUF2244 domain-containing protein [Ruegeria pomeroyi]MCE8525940.1 DUF2244 domain-containing protein [Ruegeria pomeroyi]MCE8537090.1 DUF2244 domain-containing protein [Ruegeria pomeroyi]
MPYDWKRTDTLQELHLWPHNSLPPRGAAALVLSIFALGVLPLIAVLGSPLLWGLLPFLLLAVAGLWLAIEMNYRQRRILEILTLDPERAHLVRHNPRGAVQEWDCNRYWARATMHAHGGPVPHYVTLQGGGREVEIGAFLSEDERIALYDDLRDMLAR